MDKFQINLSPYYLCLCAEAWTILGSRGGAFGDDTFVIRLAPSGVIIVARCSTPPLGVIRKLIDLCLEGSISSRRQMQVIVF